MSGVAGSFQSATSCMLLSQGKLRKLHSNGVSYPYEKLWIPNPPGLAVVYTYYGAMNSKPKPKPQDPPTTL